MAKLVVCEPVYYTFQPTPSELYSLDEAKSLNVEAKKLLGPHLTLQVRELVEETDPIAQVSQYLSTGSAVHVRQCILIYSTFGKYGDGRFMFPPHIFQSEILSQQRTPNTKTTCPWSPLFTYFSTPPINNKSQLEQILQGYPKQNLVHVWSQLVPYPRVTLNQSVRLDWFWSTNSTNDRVPKTNLNNLSCLSSFTDLFSAEAQKDVAKKCLFPCIVYQTPLNALIQYMGTTLIPKEMDHERTSPVFPAFENSHHILAKYQSHIYNLLARTTKESELLKEVSHQISLEMKWFLQQVKDYLVIPVEKASLWSFSITPKFPTSWETIIKMPLAESDLAFYKQLNQEHATRLSHILEVTLLKLTKVEQYASNDEHKTANAKGHVLYWPQGSFTTKNPLKKRKMPYKYLRTPHPNWHLLLTPINSYSMPLSIKDGEQNEVDKVVKEGDKKAWDTLLLPLFGSIRKDQQWTILYELVELIQRLEQQCHALKREDPQRQQMIHVLGSWREDFILNPTTNWMTKCTHDQLVVFYLFLLVVDLETSEEGGNSNSVSDDSIPATSNNNPISTKIKTTMDEYYMTTHTVIERTDTTTTTSQFVLDLGGGSGSSVRLQQQQ